jgi:undecaprenyl-diphosphatase
MFLKMTTFQAIIYGALHGFTEFLPISSSAHRILLAFVTGWTEPSGAFLGALSLGSVLALLAYFIHDWLSMVSCFLQVLIYRKKPMTLDERLPLFLALATLPIAVVWYYFHDDLANRLDSSPLIVSATLAGFGLLLWFADSMSRKTKNMYDWNVVDSLVVGVLEIAALIPGCGRTASTMTGALFRNYSREAAAKFGYFAAVPVLAASAVAHLKGVSFRSPAPMPELSWLSFYVAMVVAFLSSLLAIGAFMKHIHRSGMGQYVVWRLLVAGGCATLYWVRARHGAV